MTPIVRRAATAMALLIPATAQAHLVNSGLGPFYDGVAHLGLTPEDLIPSVALSLLAGQRGAHTGRATLFALPAAWLAGGVLGLAFPTARAVTPVAAVSFLVVGGLVAAEARLRSGWVIGLAVALGLAHGCLNGSAMAEARLGALSLVGLVAALFVTVALAAAMVVAMQTAWARIAVRVAGSWIVATGLLLLGWSLKGS